RSTRVVPPFPTRRSSDLFVAAQKLEDAAFLGNAWFFRILTELGRLLETADGAALPLPPPLSDGNVFIRLPLRLTRDGERVLGGEDRKSTRLNSSHGSISY